MSHGSFSAHPQPVPALTTVDQFERHIHAPHEREILVIDSIELRDSPQPVDQRIAVDMKHPRGFVDIPEVQIIQFQEQSGRRCLAATGGSMMSDPASDAMTVCRTFSVGAWSNVRSTRTWVSKTSHN